MKWNKKKIVSSLTELSQRIPTITEEPLLTILKYDYENLLLVLRSIDYERYYYFSKLIPLNDFDYSSYYTSFQQTSAEAFLKRKERIFDFALLLEQYRFINPRFIVIRRMPKDLYIETVRAFFKQFIENYYGLYLELVDGDSIHFARNNQEIAVKVNTKMYKKFKIKMYN